MMIPSGGELCLSAQRNNLNYNQKIGYRVIEETVS